MCVFLPAALHLLQAQQVDCQQARHPLAASLRIRAHVQSERTDVTWGFLGSREGRGLLPWQQLRGVSITEITWKKNSVLVIQVGLVLRPKDEDNNHRDQQLLDAEPQNQDRVLLSKVFSIRCSGCGD